MFLAQWMLLFNAVLGAAKGLRDGASTHLEVFRFIKLNSTCRWIELRKQRGVSGTEVKLGYPLRWASTFSFRFQHFSLSFKPCASFLLPRQPLKTRFPFVRTCYRQLSTSIPDSRFPSLDSILDDEGSCNASLLTYFTLCDPFQCFSSTISSFLFTSPIKISRNIHSKKILSLLFVCYFYLQCKWKILFYWKQRSEVLPYNFRVIKILSWKSSRLIRNSYRVANSRLRKKCSDYFSDFLLFFKKIFLVIVFSNSNVWKWTKKCIVSN